LPCIAHRPPHPMDTFSASTLHRSSYSQSPLPRTLLTLIQRPEPQLRIAIHISVCGLTLCLPPAAAARRRPPPPAAAALPPPRPASMNGVGAPAPHTPSSFRRPPGLPNRLFEFVNRDLLAILSHAHTASPRPLAPTHDTNTKHQFPDWGAPASINFPQSPIMY